MIHVLQSFFQSPNHEKNRKGTTMLVSGRVSLINKNPSITKLAPPWMDLEMLVVVRRRWPRKNSGAAGS